MTSFLFLRHGETDWNIEGRMQGATDIPLNDTGRQQARMAAKALEKITITQIVSSPLSRARETAEILNETLQKPLTVDDRLREVCFGAIEGLTPQEIHAKPEAELFVPGVIQLGGLRLPLGAETREDLLARTWDCIQEFLESRQTETFLFVAHGAIFATLCQHLLSEERKAANATPYRFVGEGSLWHLDPLFAKPETRLPQI